MPIVQEDSYWWRDTSLPEAEQRMRALCVSCNEERGIGFYWSGREFGYGDYDLKCFICGRQIYLRDQTEEK